MTRAAVGIDVGGTKIAGGLVAAAPTLHRAATADAPTLHRAVTADAPTPADPNGDRSAAVTLDLIERLARRAAADGLVVSRAGVGVPEYVTPRGRITSALVTPSLRTLPDASDSGLPIVVDSDVRCAARAESRFGHGRDLASFLFVIIGTGISSTLVVGGRLWTGHRGEAIALGELAVDPALALRPSAPVTVEEQASGRAIREAEHRAGANLDGQREASERRANLEDRAGAIVAAALSNAVALLDPAAVVLGGGLGTADGDFFRSLGSRYRALVGGRSNAPPLMQARLGPHAGIIGAGLLALDGRADQL